MITDFDPLKLLEDLQTGFIAMSESQQTLMQNQRILSEQLLRLSEIQARLQARQDIIMNTLSELVIDPQKKSAK
jgi:hypothetical protein